MLSAKRLYLRLRRERLVFDICSAPFGKTWFFSYRFSQIPITMMLWELLFVLAVIGAIVSGYVFLFGLFWGGIIIGLTLLGLALLLRNTTSFGWYGLDDFLLRLPIFGAVYEVLLRKETYYREDTRLMYVTLMRDIIERHVEQITGAAGIKQARFESAMPHVPHKLAELLKQPPGAA